MTYLIGPFSEIVTLRDLPLKGAIADDRLEIVTNGGVLVENDTIKAIGKFENLAKQFPKAIVHEQHTPAVLLPGFVDCHTHTCFGGTRARDFALRNAGKSYLEIAQSGGGIWNTVTQTRQLSQQQLYELTKARVLNFRREGITTIEIKSGYGLSVEEELKMLRAINQVQKDLPNQIVATCLAAHIKPKDFEGSQQAYLNYLVENLLPRLQQENLTNRIDIFTEKSAFGIEESRQYLEKVKNYGFDVCVHADQFTAGSSDMAVAVGAASADHLEASTETQINALANSETVAVVLPGASLGLGEPFASARALLDAGACVAIASDYNPGSAPMGDLLMQAAVLACFQKLSTAEVLAGLTFRAAKALKTDQLGKIDIDHRADLQVYTTADYREILYHQGKLKPSSIWKNGQLIFTAK